MLVPKIWTVLREGYTPKQFFADLSSGVIVGVVALPLALAFAIASGVTPDRGLVTAVIAGFLVSLLGGSRVQIGGPTGAFVILVYGIVQQYGLDGLVVATFMAGALLVLFGLARLGGVIKFIPRPVTIGFTLGIAVLIFSTQIKELFGLTIDELPAEFFQKWKSYLEHLGTINYWATAVSVSTVVIIVLWKRIYPRLPGAIVAMLLMAAATQLFHLPIETIGSRFGNIPNTIPAPHFPAISLELVQKLIPSAMAIALLAGVESLLSAVVADGMIGGRHRSNIELVGQGVANMASAIFGGMPATGAIARTATNVHNGGRTPVAGIVHAITLLLIMLFFGKWATLIPLSCLAGILVVISFRMAEWPSVAMILRSPRSDVLVFLMTFLLTVIFDLTLAIQVGVVLSAFLFVNRLSKTVNVKTITKDYAEDEERLDYNAISTRDVPHGVEVFEVHGPLFFGMISSFTNAIHNLAKNPKVRIIRMRYVFSIDETAINALRQANAFCRKHQIAFVLSGVHTQPLIALQRSGFLDEIGQDRIFGNIDDALNCARTILGLPTVPRPQPFVPSVEREKNLATMEQAKGQ